MNYALNTIPKWSSDLTPLEKEIYLTEMKIRNVRKWQDGDRVLGGRFGITKDICVASRRHIDMEEMEMKKLDELLYEYDVVISGAHQVSFIQSVPIKIKKCGSKRPGDEC